MMGYFPKPGDNLGARALACAILCCLLASLSVVGAEELKFYDSNGSKLPPSVTEEESDQSLAFPPEDYSPYRPSYQVQPYLSQPNIYVPAPRPGYAPLPFQPAYPTVLPPPVSSSPRAPVTPAWGGVFPWASSVIPAFPVMPYGYPMLPW